MPKLNLKLREILVLEGVFSYLKTKIHNYFEAIVYFYHFINSFLFKKEHHHHQKHLSAQFFDLEKHHQENLHS